jgi:hypothetical protein
MLPQNIHFEDGSLGKLMVWILDEQDKPVQYQFQLLVRQPPAYTLPCLLRYRFGLPQICQDITGLIPLDQIGQHAKLHPDLGRQILRTIVTNLIDASDRLLPPRQFSLHPSLIYLQPDFKVMLAFWPVKQPLGQINQYSKSECPVGADGAKDSLETSAPDPWAELRQLLSLVGTAFHIPSNDVADCQQNLSEQGLAGLQSVLDDPHVRVPGSDSSRPDPKQVSPGFAQKVRESLRTCWDGLLRCFIICRGLFVGLLSGQHEAADGEEDCQTVLLAANPADFRMAMLAEGRPGTPEENEGTRAFILVDEFIIGRDQSNVDLCLSDPGIGRLHARIIRRAGSFFICDLGSKNGTRLDGRHLLKNIEQLLPDQCILQFAKRSFYFQADGCG